MWSRILSYVYRVHSLYSLAVIFAATMYYRLKDFHIDNKWCDRKTHLDKSIGKEKYYIGKERERETER